MIDLREALTDYLELRRSLGFKLQWAEQRLSDFIDHLEDAGSAVITIPLALSWAKRPEGVRPNWWATRLGLVRCFARYVHTLDPRTEIPPVDLPAARGSARRHLPPQSRSSAPRPRRSPPAG